MVIAVLRRDSRFLVVSALAFAVSAAITIVASASMSAMGEMSMPGGWAMTMVWMPMSEHTWVGSAASFLGMWVVMMIAMMQPSLVPILCRYRRSITKASGVRLGWLTAIVSAGYF